MKAIQEVHAAKAHYRCKRTAVVTNSTFTRNARKLAKSLGVELWDRDTVSSRLLK
jgi:restriction system protein